ncbi:MAG: DHH family phosphoesterase, partial [Oscillibacter sp.]|nr:DHH family phosphoesterase [Oscillibacter sp.]
AADRLRAWNNILILTHIRPDGDTVGCAAALCAGLRAMGKTAFLLSNDGLTDTTRPYFAPYALPSIGGNAEDASFIPDKIVSVDIATENLFPKNAESYKGRVDLAVDHHPSFEGFAKENIVRPQAAACGEVLYDILSELGPITPEIALPLYVAISTDCGCFAYGNTTAHTHAVAAALMRTGIDFQTVNKVFFRTKTRLRMQLESAMLREAVFYDRDRVVVMSVPRSLMERLHATEDDAEDLSALGPQIAGVDCAVTMRELEPDEWKISLRTGPRVNASAVCAAFGGGGHAAAAGCTIKASFYEARRRILNEVAKLTVEEFT